MTRACRRCGGPLVLDIGPADAPDEAGNVIVEEVTRCSICEVEQRVTREPVDASWVRRRREAVR